MGILARLLMFPNSKTKYNALEILDNNLNEKKKYDEVHLYNPNYQLDKKIPLLFIVRKNKIIFDNILGDSFYTFDIDVPAKHDSLDGPWNVKECKHAKLFNYIRNDIENFMVIISDSRHAVKGVYNALKSLNISPLDIHVNIPRGPEALEIFRDLGEIHWTYITNIRDPHLKDAGLRGKGLQNSEVVEDFLERGGVIKALIIQNDERNLRLILGSKGSFYSQRNIPVAQFAKEIASIIAKLKELRLLKVRIPT